MTENFSRTNNKNFNFLKPKPQKHIKKKKKKFNDTARACEEHIFYEASKKNFS